MRPLLCTLLALPTLACVDEGEVCATYDGTTCEEALPLVQQQADTIAALQNTVADLQTRLEAVEQAGYLTDDDLTGYATDDDLAGYLTDDDLAGYATETWVEGGFADAATVAGLETDVTDHEGRIGVLETDAIDHDTRIAAAEDDLAALQAAGYLLPADLVGYATEAWVTAGFGTLATAGDHEVRIAAIEGDYLVADDVGDAVRLISTDATYTCADAVDVLAALAELDGRRISNDVTVTLELDPASFLFTAPLVFAHPDGQRIRIEGAGAGSTTLVFDTTDGVIVEGGSALGYLGDLTISGLGQDADGLTVTNSSAVTVGDLSVEGFASAGIQIDQNSTLDQELLGSVAISDCGYGALIGGSSYANLAQADVSDTSSNGYHAYMGSALHAERATSTDTGSSGFYAYEGSVINAPYATATNAGGDGFRAYVGSTIIADSSSAINSAADGYYINWGSYLYGRWARVETAGDDGFTAGAYSGIAAENSYVEGVADYAYATGGNSYINAAGVTGETSYEASTTHDTTDFIHSLP
ncbi:MAG: right-handed parallel beta-helix repeat-containing protein [Pseudomonadota bacterium]